MSRRRHVPSRTGRGFTLIELLIALVVLSVITALALPSFMGAIRKSRRAEAFTALSQVQQMQERWRANRAAYAGDGQLTLAPTATPPGLGVARVTPSSRYRIALSGATATGYTATATAETGGSQASDGECARLSVRIDAGNISYGSAPLSGTIVESAAGNTCWSR